MKTDRFIADTFVQQATADRVTQQLGWQPVSADAEKG